MTGKEALKHIIEDNFNMIITTYPPKPAYNGLTKEDMIAIIEKDLEVLELIKRKEPYFSRFNSKTVEEYNKIFTYYELFKPQLLTEEEFELLKEWYYKNE